MSVISKEAFDSALCAESALAPVFAGFDRVARICAERIMDAFAEFRVSDAHLHGTTGYGYGDRGRDTLEQIYARVFGCEAALVRQQITCGTHAIAIGLFGLLRTGDTMLCVTGTPYDTIQPVIGIDGKGKGMGSIADYGINYRQVDLKNQKPDIPAIIEALDESITMVYIQRSRGYDTRPSLSVEEIGEIIKAVKEHSNAVVMVDNCYGEFTQKLEPTQVGADIIAGSLIKNAGGGIARTGGYIAGRHDLVEKCAYRLTTPGLGREVGATLGMSRELFLGFYCAPHVVGEALKSAVFAASLFETLGFEASPSSEEKRCDIVQTIKLRKAENLIAFCQGLQKGSPIDAFVTPEPWDMPGYDDKVIMAAGAFTMGSSIELSADGPLREPFAVWMQGGINFYSAKTGIMLAAQEMLNKGLI